MSHISGNERLNEVKQNLALLKKIMMLQKVLQKIQKN